MSIIPELTPQCEIVQRKKSTRVWGRLGVAVNDLGRLRAYELDSSQLARIRESYGHDWQPLTKEFKHYNWSAPDGVLTAESGFKVAGAAKTYSRVNLALTDKHLVGAFVRGVWRNAREKIPDDRFLVFRWSFDEIVAIRVHLLQLLGKRRDNLLVVEGRADASFVAGKIEYERLHAERPGPRPHAQLTASHAFALVLADGVSAAREATCRWTVSRRGAREEVHEVRFDG
jgi:hypothetical protein